MTKTVKNTPSFTKADFDIFSIGDFAQRMTQLRGQISPKLAGWGEILSPELGVILGHEVFPHVAKHMRRTTNPAPETWVAFSPNKRGYKKDPCFTIDASLEGLSLRVSVKHEGYRWRSNLTNQFTNKVAKIDLSNGGDLRNFYGRKFDGIFPSAFDPSNKKDWQDICTVATKKTHAFDVGYGYGVKTATTLDLETVLADFQRLFSIYKLLWGKTGYPGF